MKGFSGFPSSKVRSTPVPNPFFSELLPQIDHLGELKVTLYCFYRLALKEGNIRYMRGSELEADETLLAGLAAHKHEAPAALAEALERATARGTLLHVQVESAAGAEDLYFVNTPKGRAAVEGITRGEWRPGADDESPLEVVVDRPNVFTLYEHNIGPLTPMIADELRDAEATYPAEWIEDAVREAVDNNARSLRYIIRVLENWQTQGRADRGKSRGNTEKDRRKYLDYLD
ncbi:MAG: DnaD domain protein [Chloroflexi bacterium]|nr:DnaD domain protein [Chloroflexota bacterium]